MVFNGLGLDITAGGAPAYPGNRGLCGKRRLLRSLDLDAPPPSIMA